LRQTRGNESGYFLAIGPAATLMAKAVELGRRRMKGMSGKQT
jgi:hypothetical protein